MVLIMLIAPIRVPSSPNSAATMMKNTRLSKLMTFLMCGCSCKSFLEAASGAEVLFSSMESILDPLLKTKKYPPHIVCTGISYWSS